MRLNGLDLNLLMVLDALLSERSVSLAALNLDLGQSAVSAALARLRNHFEDDLLVPLNRQMVPTALAANLQPQVRAFLQRIDAVMHAQPEFEPRRAQRGFVILCSDYLVPTYMPYVIRRLADEAPNVSLSLRPLTASHISTVNTGDDFERRGADFMILPEEFASPRHPCVSLFSEAYCCVCWTGNIELGESLEFGQFRDMPHVAVQFVEPASSVIESRLLAKGASPLRIKVVVDEYLLVPELVIGTSNLSIVPLRFAQSLLPHSQLRIFELPSPAGPINVKEVLQWNGSLSDDPAVTWVRNTLLDAARVYEAPNTTQ